MPNETLIKMAIGAGVVAILVLAFLGFRSFYIHVGREQIVAEQLEAKQAEALRQATGKANALLDAAERVAVLKDSDELLRGALNNSEVLNHEEIDTPCLSDARRLRINATH